LANLNLGNFNNAQNMALESGRMMGALSDQELQQALSRAGPWRSGRSTARHSATDG